LLGERGWKLARSAWQGAQVAEARPDRLGAPALSPQLFREVEARRLAICLREASPGMEKKWQNALSDLSAIVQGCQQRAVPLAVVLIPDEFQVNNVVLNHALEDARLTADQIELDAPQQRLLAFFGERGVPCLDLLPTFRKVPNTYAPCDTHWNVTGNRLAAKEIGKWLSRERAPLRVAATRGG
jgi:hypothetical protein